MNIAIKILKDEFKKRFQDSDNIDSSNFNSKFWRKFTTSLLDYETEPKSLYIIIYNLNLDDPEIILSKIPEIYHLVISNLAELYANGGESEAITYLINTENKSFNEELKFYKTLNEVIKKSERINIKKELPTMAEKVNFELDDNVLKNTIKKQSREDLKQKFAKWDLDIKNEQRTDSKVFYQLNNQNILTDNPEKTKKRSSNIFNLSFVKYAVAASVLFALGVWYYSSFDTIKNIPEDNLAEISIDTSQIDVIQNINLGFASKPIQIKIIENLIGERKKSIVDLIKTYQVYFDNELKNQNRKTQKKIEKKTEQLKIELQQLKNKEKQYIFENKTLNVFSTSKENNYNIIECDGIFYLIKNRNLYQLMPTKIPVSYKTVKDSLIINQIDDILFANGLQTLTD